MGGRMPTGRRRSRARGDTNHPAPLGHPSLGKEGSWRWGGRLPVGRTGLFGGFLG
jgi:hypothetical protein